MLRSKAKKFHIYLAKNKNKWELSKFSIYKLDLFNFFRSSSLAFITSVLPIELFGLSTFALLYASIASWYLPNSSKTCPLRNQRYQTSLSNELTSIPLLRNLYWTRTVANFIAPTLLISTKNASIMIPKTTMKVYSLLAVSDLAFFIIRLPDVC